MKGDTEVPALLRAKVNAEDNVAIKKTVGLKVCYMVLSEFEQEAGAITTKVFPTESACKSYANGQEIIKVEVIRKFE